MLRYLLLVITFSFFSFANLPLEITYNENNQPLVIEYEDGSTILYEYDAMGRLLSVENSNDDMVTFTYDRNGNQTGWNNTQNSNNRFITWDEENRIETVSVPQGHFFACYSGHNGHTSYYVYAPQGHFLASSRHASGERTLKRSSQGETFYVNAYFVIREGQVASKHFFAGSQRIATKLTKQESQTIPEPVLGTVTQEEIDQATLRVTQAQTRVDETQAAYDAAKGSDKKPAKDTLDEAKDALQTAQDALATLLETQAQTQTSTEKTANAKPVNIIYEKQQYYYHPDHLGSSSFVTDAKGKVYEHLEYFPFGETWAHEHSNTQRTPYRFTGKEYDETTGLYYYGARYYDPRTSVWQSVDPILGEYMDDGGIFDPSNLQLFIYTGNNPVNMVDPDGLRKIDFYTRSFAPFNRFGFSHHGDDRGYSMNLSQSSRITSYSNVDTTSGSVSGGKTWSDESRHPILGKATGKPTGSSSASKVGNTTNVKTKYSGSNPLMLAPKIDVEGSTKFTENSNGTLSIGGSMKGDGFPSTESFIKPKGSKTGIFLGVGQISKGTDPDFGPGQLFGGADKNIMNYDLTIGFDTGGNINSVRDNIGKKSYDVDSWNNKFYNTTPVKVK